MHVRLSATLFDIQSPRNAIVRLDFSERYAIWEVELISRADLCLLKWVGVSVNRATIRATHAAHEFEARYRGSLFEQIRVGQISKAEILPPRCFGLATRPVKQVREQPPGLLLRTALVAFGWQVSRERTDQFLH
ncbi:MAG: hypothetical protein ACREVJ_13255, partial [Gammaproteobacteria bacterium]